MATAFAPRTAMQRSTAPASTSNSASLNISFQPALSAALRRSGTASSSSRGARTVPLAFRGQSWGGQNFQRRGSCGPVAWQFGAPFTQATLEDLAREFGFQVNPQCNTRQQKNGFRTAWENAASAAATPLDFEEQESQYLVTVDVPGLQKADLKITVNKDERSLTISGERRRQQSTSEQESESSDAAKAFKRRFERPMGKFQRTLPSLPENADLAAVTARVEKGVLAVTIRKLPEVKQPDNTVNIDID